MEEALLSGQVGNAGTSAGLLNPFNAGVQRVLSMPGGEEHRKVRLWRRKPHARFDEGGMVEAVMVRIVRHRRTKGAETDRPNLKPHRPSLYSTHIPSLPDLPSCLTVILSGAL